MPSSIKGGRAIVQLQNTPRLSKGVPAELPEEQPGERDAQGRFLPASGTAQRRPRRSRVLRKHVALGYPDSEKHERNAYAWLRQTVERLARLHGGGCLEPWVVRELRNAARLYAWQDYLIEHSPGDESALKVGTQARQHLQFALDGAARDAKAKAQIAPPVSALQRLAAYDTEGESGD